MKKTIVIFLLTFVVLNGLGSFGIKRAAASKWDHSLVGEVQAGTSGAEEYTFSSISGAYNEITGGTVSTATGDDGFQDFNLPFVFTYDSLTFDTARISVNGWLQLGQTYAGSGSANDLANADVRPILAPFWDDLYDDSTSEIRYQLLGISPDQVLVVQWKGVRWPGSGGSRQNFQLRFYENGNIIEFIYGSMSSSTNTSASIGLSGASASYGKFLSVTPGSPASASSTVVNNQITSVNYLTSGTTYQFLPPCFHVWLGLLSQEWSDPGNWNCEAVPGAADNATVTGAGTHMPKISSTVSLAKLDIDPGNSLTLQGGSLNIEAIRIEGSLTVNGNETISISGTNLAWNRLPVTGTFNPGTGSVSFQGTGILTMHSDEEFNILTIESGKTYDPGEYQLDVKGTFTNRGTIWPSHESSKMHFLGPVVNQGNWRGQLSSMIFNQGFENLSSGTFYASQNTDVGTEFHGNVTNHGIFNAAESGKLSIHGDWMNDGNFSPGAGTLTLASNGKQFFTGGGETDYYNITLESGADVELQGDLTVLHDLQIKAGSGLDLAGKLLKVDNALLNSGNFSQTLQVSSGSAVNFLKIPDRAGTRWVYWGLSLNPVADMGLTRVTVRGSPQGGCSLNPSDSLISRCFVIEPQNPAVATIRFYFLGSEMNGQIFDEMKVWHFGTIWSQVGTNYTHSDGCAPGQLDCWFEAEAISEYSLFGIGSGEVPTQVKLVHLSADQKKGLVEVLVLTVLFVVLIGICNLLKKFQLKIRFP